MNAEAAARWPFPGLVWGPYPQLRLPIRQRRRPAHLGGAALAREADIIGLTLQHGIQLEGALRALRGVTPVRRDEAWTRRALATAATAMQQVLGLRAYREQLMAARALLDQRLVEMDTGEGKTLAIALAAGVAALAGTPVHVVTANEYLAQRDAEALAPFYARLGLGAGWVGQAMDMDRRRAAYACAVTYCTAKELAFDYLRDRLLHPEDLSPLERSLREAMAPRPSVLRGLCMAILDEADTILIDEARVPLILSQPAGGLAEELFLRRAFGLAQRLQQGLHWRLEGAQPRLTEAGRARLQAWPADAHPLLGHPQHRASTLELAIQAVHLLQRDREYVLREGAIHLVDETTGRTAPGRAWSRGLHQLVEIKEGLALTRRNETLSQITFQRFFVRYLRLAGISGTLRGSGGELRAIYGLGLVRVPPRMPRQVQRGATRLFGGSSELWQAVAARAAALLAQRRAVLVGTESVQHSEALVSVLRARGLQPVVLHAREDREENEVIGRAGQPGRLTVATSMAGRGADIPLAPEVLARGGLHVLLCQLNASPRIDRQFLGRAGRHGQPGSCETWVALDFPLLQKWLAHPWQLSLRARVCNRLFGVTSLRAAQALEGWSRRQQRARLAALAEEQERELNFSRWGSS